MGSSDDLPSHGEVAEILRRTLNRHGYGFQSRVLMACHETRIQGEETSGRWNLVADEYPVSVSGHDLHVDGVLEFLSNDPLSFRMFSVVECKRVDPKIGRWCFAKSDTRRRPAILDVYRHQPIDAMAGILTRVEAMACSVDRIESTTQLGIELKAADVVGNGLGKSLDSAISQVLRGAAGVAEGLPDWIPEEARAVVVPLLVTTADLFRSNTMLVEADLFSGDLAALELESVQWLWYTANVSNSLLPDVSRDMDDSPNRSITNAIAHRHSRGIVIANVRGLEAALTAIVNATFDLRKLP
jgi:hypothetical protein